MDKETLSVAVVGMGKMGLLHASLLRVLANVQLQAVCEKSSVTRKLLKKVFRGIPLVEDVNEFSDMGLDAVFITTPIPSHFIVAKTVYQEKLAQHVFIEKTLASNYSESKELCELANKNGGVNMVGYTRRFMVTFLKAKELLEQNVIGKPLSFRINAFSSDFFGVHENPTASIARGGVLRDLGSHAIDIALWFFGDLQVGAAKVVSLTGENAEDAVHFAVKRDSEDLQGEFSVSWCMEGYRMAEVALLIKGSGGIIEVNDNKVSLTRGDEVTSIWHRQNLNDLAPFWLGGPEYYREDAYFTKAIRENLAPEPSFNTASKVDLLIETIQKGAKRYA